MASKGRDADAPACTVCGGQLNGAWECTICGTKHSPQGRGNAPPMTRDQAVEVFTQIPGVSETKARALYESGYASLDSLGSASPDKLAKVQGIGERLAKGILEAVPNLVVAAPMNGGNGGSPAGKGPGRDALSAWLTGGGEQGLNTWLGGGVNRPDSTSSDDALKRWLTGEDGALGSWLGEGAPGTIPAPDARIRDSARLLEERDRELHERDLVLEGLRAELSSIKRTMSNELASFKSGAFDPMRYVEETARLNKELQLEIKLRRQLEEEIGHVKKGSIAVIKYVKAHQGKDASSPDLRRKLTEEGNARRHAEIEFKKTQEVLSKLQAQIQKGLGNLKPDERAVKQREIALIEKEAALKAKEEELSSLEAASHGGEIDVNGGGLSEEVRFRLQEELREKEQEFVEKEEDLRKRVISLEEEVSRFKIDEQLRADQAALTGKPKGEVDAILARREGDLMTKEKSIRLRENEIKRLNEELGFTKDEMGKLQEQVKYKDDELQRREEDLLYRERLLQAERRKIDEAKAQGFSSDEKEMKDRLEQLKSEINMKEEEVRAKEKFLKSKMEELRLREQGLIDEDMEAREEERMLEIKQEKIKTGSPRLDDLLLGGIPFGSNVSVYGPAYVGKDVIVNAFMAEGLKKGIPAIFIITDKSPGDIREEMAFVLPGYDVYEQKGLVKYIDAYSRSMGSEENDPYTVYLMEPTDYEAILKATDDVAKEFKKNHEYYRLCFRSVSTLIAYLDPSTMFKFLQPFAGRRKRDKAVSFYLLEKGMHGEQEIQMLGSIMDGSVEIKVEQLKSYLAVKGICDVQSRAWIRYTYSKQAVNIGSFSLDHIR